MTTCECQNNFSKNERITTVECAMDNKLVADNGRSEAQEGDYYAASTNYSYCGYFNNFHGVIVEFRSKNFRSLREVCKWSTDNTNECVVVDSQNKEKNIGLLDTPWWRKSELNLKVASTP